MQPNPDTLRFIRQITEDGVLTDEEIWSLGNFLNEHADAQNNWPGNILFEILQHAFDDGRLDPHEVEAIGYYLRGIELQCSFSGRDDEPEPAADYPADLRFDVIEFRLPALNDEVEVPPSMQFEKTHRVNLAKHECDCAEFAFKRKFLPEGSLGRACKHMVKALDSPTIEKKIPKLAWNSKLFQLVQHHAEMNRSLSPVPSWKLLKAEDLECVVSWGDNEWAHVFAQNQDGQLERFGYNLQQNRWAYGTTPPAAEAITRYLEDPNAMQSK
ncbi:MAG: hypothetical protein ISQ14_04985 [Verrucomicrobiae bacterium]|nr:hypothetical protein [Verrucomicrobiae bacterium]